MCLKGTPESCVLLERVTKVEVRQTFIICVVLAMFAVVTLIAFKLLNAQIYMLTGCDGLRNVSTETRADVKVIGIDRGATIPCD